MSKEQEELMFLSQLTSIYVLRLSRPTGDAALKDLQLRVNEVTKAAKWNDKERLAKATESVSEAAARLP